MTDFYSVLRRAIGNLGENTTEARRQLYARAETALVAQLQKADPPADEPRIAQMRDSLRAAAKKIEDEEAGRAPAPAAPVAPAAAPAAPATSVAPTTPAAPVTPGARAIPGAPGYVSPLRQRQTEAGTVPGPVVPPPTPQPAAPAAPVPPAAPAVPSQPAPPAHARQTQPAPVPEPGVEMVEPAQDESAYGADTMYDARDQRPADAPSGGTAFDGWPESAAYDLEPRRRPWGWLIALVVIGGLAGVGYWQRDAIMQAAEPLIALIQQDGTEEPKVDVRLSEGEDDGAAQPDVPAAPVEPDQPAEVAPAPGRIEALLVEEAETPQTPPIEIPGSVQWTLKREDGSAFIEGAVQIPARNVSLVLMIHKNTDPAFPATHTIDFIFNLPPGFGGGGINNVPGLLTKATPKARGGPLAGEVVRVDEGIYLMALLAGEVDAPRNIQALSTQPFLDVPVIYANGQRAIITLAKGPEGEAVFSEAFGEWGQ